MEPGLFGEHSLVVDESKCARVAVLRGRARLFATPEMIRAMEIACYNAVDSCLSENQGTVGTFVNVKHTRATPTGDTVIARGELVKVDGRKLLFHVEARDSRGDIGRGEHGRYIVDIEDFVSSLKG